MTDPRRLPNVAPMKVVVPLLLAALLCGCQPKPDPYAKLDDALARFESALQGPISHAEFRRFVNDVRYERDKVKPLIAALNDTADEKTWWCLERIANREFFNAPSAQTGYECVNSMRMSIHLWRTGYNPGKIRARAAAER